MNKKTTQLTSLALFLVLGYAAIQIPLTYLLGSNTRLTVFDSLAPIAGGLFSLPAALLSLLVIQSAAITSITAASIIKLVTPLAAVFYFSKQNKLHFIIPVVAIIVFINHPVGRSVWYYSLFWTIPVICYFLKEKSVITKALGATFSAHAVGGSLWIYLVPMTKTVWVSLIPIVAIERLTLALGTALFYFAFAKIRVEINKRAEAKTLAQEGGH
jgi:hypothetical protein